MGALPGVHLLPDYTRTNSGRASQDSIGAETAKTGVEPKRKSVNQATSCVDAAVTSAAILLPVLAAVLLVQDKKLRRLQP
jgi:hypothetical protein